MNSEQIEKEFPGLSRGNYKITSPATGEYNGIAWAVGETDCCWWPDQNRLYYWPRRAPRAQTVDAFIKALGTAGYAPCQNADYEKDCTKLAIYADAAGIPTHVARQIGEAAWTSKLGQLEDIQHSLHDLSGSDYGQVVQILVRPKKTKGHSEDALPGSGREN